MVHSGSNMCADGGSVINKVPEFQNAEPTLHGLLQSLPNGKYTLVGVDIDTTGRRLIDEIVQLAAYTPTEHFEQYIMPYMNLNPAARQRHQVRVISIGFYRMLKSMQTYKIIKSKSEIAALKDFLNWLEDLKNKDANSLGIILVYHEERKFIPYMILESLQKYNLLDRFFLSVKSFANGLNLAKVKGNDNLQHYSLRRLSRVLSAKLQEKSQINEISSTTDAQKAQRSNARRDRERDRDLFDGNASVRAKLAYEVALQLSNQNNNESIEPFKATEHMLSALLPFAKPIVFDLSELKKENENLERQNSFRPVFLHYFKSTLYHRVRAVKFRIVLAAQGYNLKALNEIWNEKKKDGLVASIEKITDLKADDKTELIELFDSFFDPTKTTIKPVIRKNLSLNRRRNKRNVGGRAGNMKIEGVRNEQGASGDKPAPPANGANLQQQPDSTTKSPIRNNGGKPQRRRSTRTRRIVTKPQNAGTAVGVPNAVGVANNVGVPNAVAVTNAMPMVASN